MGYLIFKEKQYLGIVVVFFGFGVLLVVYCELKEYLGVVVMEIVVELIIYYYCCYIELWLRVNGGVVSLVIYKCCIINVVIWQIIFFVICFLIDNELEGWFNNVWLLKKIK